MDKVDFQKLMEQTFKSSFLVNLLTKLYAKEITQEDFKKLLNEKKLEITKQNPSFTEMQNYQALMTISEEKLEVSNSTTKVIETKEKPITPESKGIIQQTFPFYYLIILLCVYSLSLFMTASNVKFGKPVLVHNNELKSDGANFRFLENVNENNTNFELYSEEKNVKFNFKEHSFLIMPKMKKIIYPTVESALGCLIKFGLNAVNIFVALFGRFFDKKFIRWLKIRMAFLFFFLPIIRMYMLYKINCDYIANYQNEAFSFYKSKELFQYNPKNLPYNLRVETANSLFSMFLAMNHISAFVVEAFYKSNNYVSEMIKKFFDIKNKLS
jgi:hypothetical protein